MKKDGLIVTVVVIVLALAGLAFWLHAQNATDPTVEGFKVVEVASAADAIEQLYGTKAERVMPLRLPNLAVVAE